MARLVSEVKGTEKTDYCNHALLSRYYIDTNVSDKVVRIILLSKLVSARNYSGQ